MIISRRSQLALMLLDTDRLKLILEHITVTLKKEQSYLELERDEVSKKLVKLGAEIREWGEDLPPVDTQHVKGMATTAILTKEGWDNLVKGGQWPKAEFLFLITRGVEDCSKMIRIGDYFSTTAFNKMKFGAYRYLLGKNEMVVLTCRQGIITGMYWHDINGVCFEFGFDLTNDKYYAPHTQMAIFNRIAKLITFIELGDIETVYLPAGRNNGKPKKAGKITNTSEFNVYIVDTSWNKLIIRTDGFGVRGHFRLQPCGKEHKDRKLIWVDSFEKHGYVRRPKAAIRD